MREALELLEWPQVFERLCSLCLTPYGRQQWEAEPFLSSVTEIRHHLQEVDVLKGIVMRFGEPLLDATVPDARSALRRVAKGGVLSLSELREILLALKNADTLLAHLEKHLEKDPAWQMLAPRLEEAPRPLEAIALLETYVDPLGNLLDSASPVLARLRQRVLAERASIQKTMQQYLYHPTYGPALQSPVITERDGRSVLPVKVEQKSIIPGIIHAGSGSGATLYIEPDGVIDLNNRLQKTQGELQVEIQRILKVVSDALEAYGDALLILLERVGALDKRIAAARLSIILKGNVAEVVADAALCIDLKNARHPLLVFQGVPVVANPIALGQDEIRTMLITGPNTGGKTVLLKTVGLCAVMLHAGLHLPVDEHSRLSLMDPILVDIGDQQSIAQNLSTFSAHLERMKSFVADETDLSRGLVLIDEIAAGTDPAEGAALAKAVLDELYEKGALTVATTHLGELKLEAHHHKGYTNASVEFDPEKLSPTYRLTLGTPGTSNAITIAQRLGLKGAVVEKARRALSQPVRDSASLIESLEQKNRKAELERHQAESFRLAAQESYERLELQRQQLQEDRRRVLEQSRSTLRASLQPLETELKELRDALRALERGDTQAVYDLSRRVKGVGKSAADLFGEMAEKIEAENEIPPLSLADLKVGEEVRSKRLNLRAEITALHPQTDKVSLQSGALSVMVPVSDIEKMILPRKSTSKKKSAVGSSGARASSIPTPRDASQECDIRGMRVDDAMERVQKFLDDAVLAGYETVGIIHGQGTGALKQAVRDFLKNLPAVKTYYPAEAQFGGDGKTFVEFL